MQSDKAPRRGQSRFYRAAARRQVHIVTGINDPILRGLMALLGAMTEDQVEAALASTDAIMGRVQRPRAALLDS